MLQYSDGTEIETTWNHPFYIQDKGWVEVKDLEVGDLSLTSRDTVLEIQAIRMKPAPQTVYNIHLDKDHTYFVTDSDVLVHNYEQLDARYGKISKGDSLEKISKKTGATKAEICALNPDKCHNLKYGEKLLLPENSSARHSEALKAVEKRAAEVGQPDLLEEFKFNHAFEKEPDYRKRVAMLQALVEEKNVTNLSEVQISTEIKNFLNTRDNIKPRDQLAVAQAIFRVMQQESGTQHIDRDGTIKHNPNLEKGISNGIDIGIMQLNSRYYINYYRNAIDPGFNIRTGMERYLRYLKAPYGPAQVGRAYQRYNGSGDEARQNRAKFCTKTYAGESERTIELCTKG